ncbi:MAG: hypothetical protein DRQ41_00980, partial [Gammaproteobacteria bacterium]
TTRIVYNKEFINGLAYEFILNTHIFEFSVLIKFFSCNPLLYRILLKGHKYPLSLFDDLFDN